MLGSSDFVLNPEPPPQRAIEPDTPRQGFRVREVEAFLGLEIQRGSSRQVLATYMGVLRDRSSFSGGCEGSGFGGSVWATTGAL